MELLLGFFIGLAVAVPFFLMNIFLVMGGAPPREERRLPLGWIINLIGAGTGVLVVLALARAGSSYALGAAAGLAFGAAVLVTVRRYGLFRDR